jgi:prepilin-type N-terminal cleavage/methylation domain-containing protein
MNLPNPRRTPRAGFTLIEMMLVVVIIGILVALISSAAVRAVVSAKQARNLQEIRQLSVALENFKSKFGAYPPSRIKLCEAYGGYYQSAIDKQLDDDSIQFLTRMFPRLDVASWAANGIDWDGNATLSPPITLTGDQCLVFFLGGIPGRVPNPSCLGFSTNPRNPAATGGDRIGPFFEFQGNRLTPVGAPFYSYLDRYEKQPYAYFSSYKTTNGYNRYFPIYGNSDCATLPNGTATPGVFPYLEGPNRYLNPNSYQIVSAGADGVFGPGTVTPTGPFWSAANASLFYPDNTAGRDDQSNFHEAALGVEIK